MSTPKPRRQSTLSMTSDSPRVKDMRSFISYPPEHKVDLVKQIDKDREWERKLFSMHDPDMTYAQQEKDYSNFKKRGWKGPLQDQPPVRSPAKKQLIKQTKAWLLPDTYKKAMVAGGTDMHLLFETTESDEAMMAAVEKAEAERESDMDAELWRAAEEAQAVYDTQKIEKEINAAEKEYSDKIEAIKLKKKTIAKVTSHIDLTHDDGSGMFIHL